MLDERCDIPHIDGNIRGIKPSQWRALERTYRRRVPLRQAFSPELARHLTEISKDLGRQVGVLLSRDGTIRTVIVGDASRLVIPEIGRLRGGTGRFRGLRLIHTHLRGEDLSRDDLNDLALLRLDLVAMIEVQPDGAPGRVELAHILPGMEGEPFRRIRARDIHQLDFDFEAEIRAVEGEFSRLTGRHAGRNAPERALVVILNNEEDRRVEMVELVRAAGVEVAAVLPQKHRQIHPRTILGKGTLQTLVLEGMRSSANVVVFDIDLKPAQARAFEDATALKAVDRTQVILDIFAQRARSRAGKLQVELAQLKYSLPRLTEKDAGLSRLRGGIGGRGPGETTLEIGRRRTRDRIRSLEKSIGQLSRQRNLRRRRRNREELPVLSIIGYTNAGKSTLLNALTESRIDEADQMFVTLDPTSRRLRFPREGDVIVTDTVGFIEELPPDLLEAFRATLEELYDADLLIHVVDASDPRLERKMDAVEKILTRLELRHIPRLLVLNKSDLLEEPALQLLCRRHACLAVSAAQRRGLGKLIEAAEKSLMQAGSSQGGFRTSDGRRDLPA